VARVLADLSGKIPAEDWESLVEAGVALWNAAMGDYNTEQLTADHATCMAQIASLVH